MYETSVCDDCRLRHPTLQIGSKYILHTCFLHTVVLSVLYMILHEKGSWCIEFKILIWSQ